LFLLCFVVQPPTFFFVRAGLTLEALSSPSDAMNWQSIALLIVLGIVSMLPTLPGVQRALLGDTEIARNPTNSSVASSAGARRRRSTKRN
jgi:hypothetical protein